MRLCSFRQGVRVAAAGMITLLLCLLGGEVCSRLFGGPPAAFLYGASHRDVQTDWDLTYGVDTHHRRVSCASRKGKKIAVLGDSFVFGQGVADCADFCSVATANSAEFSFDNYGIIGAGINEYALVARDLISAEYHAVVLVLYGNDAHLLSAPRNPLGRMADYSAAVSVLRRTKRAIVVQRELAKLAQGKVFNNVIATVRQYSDYEYLAVNPDPADLALLQTKFAELIATLRARGIGHIYVAVVPTGSTVSKRLRNFVADNGGKMADFGRPGKFYGLVAELSQRHGLQFVDTFPTFLTGGEAAYFPHDMHWTATGHRMMAELILANIEGPAKRPSSPAVGGEDPHAGSIRVQ